MGPKSRILPAAANTVTFACLFLPVARTLCNELFKQKLAFSPIILIDAVSRPKAFNLTFYQSCLLQFRQML